jgi:hypothetical protein
MGTRCSRGALPFILESSMSKIVNIQGTQPLAVRGNAAETRLRVMAAGVMTAWGAGIMNTWSLMDDQQLYPPTRRSSFPKGSEGHLQAQLLAREIQPFQH